MKSKIRQLKTKVLSFLAALLLSSSVYAQLTGGTTVGINGVQSPPFSFSTVSNAFTYLNASGVTGTGTIVLEIQSGYTGETTTIPALNAYTGMNVGTPIILRPGFGMTPTISTTLATNNAVIRFNGARFFTIDGSNSGTNSRDLTITTSSTTASNALVGLTPTATSSCKFITVKNCNLVGNSSTSAINTAYGIYLGGATIPGAALIASNDSNRFENNFIGAVRTGVYLRGIGTGTRDNFNVVYANNIGGDIPLGSSTPTNFIGGANSQSGVYLASQNLAVIDSNVIKNSLPAFYAFMGIDMTLTTQVSTNISISRNSISNIRYSGSGVWGSYGMRINLGASVNNLGHNIFNNAIWNISTDGSTSNTSVYNPYGMYFEGTATNAGVNLYHNSINLYGSPTNFIGSGACILFGSSISGGVRMVNNMLKNTMNGTTGTSLAYTVIAANTTTSPFSVINNNLYFANAAAPTVSRIGFIRNTQAVTLANWQTSTGQDANSLSANPALPNDTNLYVTSGILGGSGRPITTPTFNINITSDIAGITRDVAFPGIGASEAVGANMVFDSSSVEQVTVSVPIGSNNQPIVRIRIHTSNFVNPVTLTQLKLNTLGTTSALDIDSAKVFFTGSNPNFATTNQFGTTTNNPNGNYYVNGSRALQNGVNYFWVTYSVRNTATPSNLVDAALDSLTISGTQYAPIISAPVGARTIAPPLNGIYTVGTGGTYPTLNAALNDLNVLGASGNVTFNVVSNITEPGNVIIQQWQETGLGNYRLRIVPTNNDTIFVNSANSGAITLVNADRVTIDGRIGGTGNNLTVINTNTAAISVGILVASMGTNQGCENDSIVNVNILTGANTASSFGIQAQGDNNNNLVIANNNFKRAWGAINVFTTNFPAGANFGLRITGNTIGDVANSMNINRTGINITNSPNALIDNNKLYNINDILSTLNYGIQIGSNCDSARITLNKIDTVFNGNTGGYSAYGINITGSNNLLIANNIVTRVAIMNYSTSSTTWNPFGIRITAGIGHRIYYNSVNMYGPSLSGGTAGTLSAALLVTGGSGLDVRNNIFVNSYNGLSGSQSFAIYSTVASPFTNINYNNYFVSGTFGVLGFLTSNRTNIAAWRLATNQDLFSISGNPYFTANDDLVINSGSIGNQMESAGTPVSVNTDYNGDARPKTVPTTYGGNTAPDMGAFEFDGQPIDLGQPIISFTPLTNTSLTSNRNLVANITDLLSGVDSSTNAPRVYFKKSTDANAFVGNTASDNGWKFTSATKSGNNYTATIDYSIINGGFVMVNDTIEYFYVAQDLATTPNTSALPSIGFVGTSVSAITSAPTTPNRYLITNPPLAGTYTVGSTGTFPTLTAAVGTLNVVGVSAPVIFELTDATYTSSTETFPITINQFGGGNSTNRVTIKPAASNTVSITGSSTTSIFRLNGADFITIDGSNGTNSRDLTITNTSNSANSATVWLSSLGPNAGATNNRIVNCNIEGNTTSTVSVFGIISTGNTIGNTSSGEDNDSLVVENNNFTKLGVGVYVSGTTTNNHKGVVISKNTIGNSIAANTVNSLGIYVMRTNGITINANNLKNITGNNTGSPITLDGTVGILIEAGVVNAVISKNIIDSVVYAGTGGYAGKGIDINTNIPNSNIEVSNNMVSNILGDGWSSLSTDGLVGLRVIGTAGNIRFYHNTVHLNGIANRSSATVSAAIYAGANVTNLIVRNNIFINGLVNNTTASKSYAVSTDITNPTNVNINYNNYFSYGTQGVFGFLGADVASLAAWRSAIGQDANSISDSTSFVSLNDLHLTGSSIGNFAMKAAPIVGLNTDIDNDIRSASFYYMGADEVTSAPLPVKLVQFTGVTLNNDVKLTWTTASETNNKGFYVERSVDGKLFEIVKFVTGAGNSVRTINYQMIDQNAFTSNNVNVLYYRLKQVDFDGKFDYSTVVKIVKNDSKINGTVVYPNPFANQINVSFTSASNNIATIEILDIQGKLIQTNSLDVVAGFNNLTINNLNVLNNGFYFVRLTVNGEKQTYKLVKN